MAVSKWARNRADSRVAEVLALYRSNELLTMIAIAQRTKLTYHNVSFILNTFMPEAERRALARVRYSESKLGKKNPQKGKRAANWKGECDDGYGYLTCLHKGKRVFVHRLVMAKALGLVALPRRFAVHHIDGNPKNNELDNLALVTDAGHKAVHFMQVKDAKDVVLKKLRLAEAMKYLTSR